MSTISREGESGRPGDNGTISRRRVIEYAAIAGGILTAAVVKSADILIKADIDNQAGYERPIITDIGLNSLREYRRRIAGRTDLHPQQQAEVAQADALISANPRNQQRKQERVNQLQAEAYGRTLLGFKIGNIIDWSIRGGLATAGVGLASRISSLKGFITVGKIARFTPK